MVESRTVAGGDGLRITPPMVVQQINRSSAVVIDLQEVDSFREAHIVGAINVPLSMWSVEHKALPSDKDHPVILVDKLGDKAPRCAAELQKAGFVKASALQGGLDAWRTAKLPLVKGNK